MMRSVWLVNVLIIILGCLQTCCTTTAMMMDVVLPCDGTVELPLRSNTAYVLADCSVAAYRLSLRAQPLADVSNVSVDIAGGSVVPSVDLTGVASVSNLYIVVSSVVMGIGGGAAVRPLLTVSFSGISNPSRASGISVVVDGGSVLRFARNESNDNATAAGLLLSLITHDASYIDVRVVDSVIFGVARVAIKTPLTQGSSLFQISAINSASNIRFAAFNGTVMMVGTTAYNRIVDIDVSGSDISDLNTAEYISVQADNRSNFSMVVDCLSPASVCSTMNTNYTSTSSSIFHISHPIGEFSHVSVVFHNSHFSMQLLQNVELQKTVTLNAFLMERGAVQISSNRDMSISMSYCTLWTNASDLPSLFTMSGIFSDIVGLLIDVHDIAAVQVADGGVTSTTKSRGATLMYLHMNLANAVVSVSNVVVEQHVLSGPSRYPLHAGGTSSSAMLTLNANLVDIDANMTNVTLFLNNCSLNADIRNGTLPMLSPLPVLQMQLGFATAAMITFSKAQPAVNVSVVVDRCSVFARMGFYVVPSSVLLSSSSYVFVSSTVAIIVAQMNCNLCSFLVTNSRVELLEMDFVPPPTGGRASPPRGKGCFNLTMIFVAVDMRSLIMKTLPQMLLSLVSMSSPVFLSVTHVNVTIAVRNSVILVSDGGNKQNGLLSIEDQRMIVSAFVGLPETMVSSSITVSLPLNSRSSYSSPPHGIACVFGCDLASSDVSVLSPTSSSVGSVGALMVVLEGDANMTQSTTLTFRDLTSIASVRGAFPPLVAGSGGGGGTGSSLPLLLSSGVVQNSKLRVDDGSKVSVDHVSFDGPFASLSPGQQQVQWGRDVGDGQQRRSLLSLGCNLLRGSPMPLRFVTATVPRDSVAFSSSSWNESIECVYSLLPSPTMTRSEMAPVAPVPLVVLDGFSYIPAAAASASAWTAGITTIVSFGAVVSGADAGLAMDAQMLGAMGLSGCAPSALRSAAGPSRYLLSPFVDLGRSATVFGNLGVIVCA